jgi:hypothetical protein
MVKHSKSQQSIANRAKHGIFRDILSFFLRLHPSIKEKYSTEYNYSILLPSTRNTFQYKEKYSTQYNYSILQLEYFFINFTMPRICMHKCLDLLELLVDACCS